MYTFIFPRSFCFFILNFDNHLIMTWFWTDMSTSHFFLTYLLTRGTRAKMTRMWLPRLMVTVWRILTFLPALWGFCRFFHTTWNKHSTCFTITRYLLYKEPLNLLDSLPGQKLLHIFQNCKLKYFYLNN